tara:strand:- start:494 stop:742 length:249 start_codon:yes stop_codon:yes gene_type:complete
MKNLSKSLLCLSLIGLFSINTQAQSFQVRGLGGQGVHVDLNKKQVKGHFNPNIGAHIQTNIGKKRNVVLNGNIRFFILPELY